MKKLFTLLLFSFAFGHLFAQTYKTEFTYDYAGNRISRKVIVLNPVQSRSTPGGEESPLQEELSRCHITVYPNPTKGKLVVAISNGGDTDIHKMYAYTAGGELIFSESLTGNGDVTIDLSDRQRGVYILSVRTGDDEAQYKIVKQ